MTTIEDLKRLMEMQDDSLEEPDGVMLPSPREAIADTLEAKIMFQFGEVLNLLLAKNAAYGNSALDPVRILSKSDPIEQLKVRIDDKLSRIKRGNGYGDEDAILDLLGYLIMLRIALHDS
jgi:hypothetical protein